MVEIESDKNILRTNGSVYSFWSGSDPEISQGLQTELESINVEGGFLHAKTERSH